MDAVGGIVGGLFGNKAAGKAADAQVQAANTASQTQLQMFNQGRADQAPYREAGHAALNQLAFRLGLTTTGFGGEAFTPKTEQQFRNDLLSQYTSGGNGSLSGAAGSPLSVSYGPDGSLTYAPAQVGQSQSIDEAGLSAAVQKAMQAQSAEQAKRDAQSQAVMTDPNFGSLLRNFSAADMQADPVYQSGLQFGLSEGTKGIDRAFAAKGGALSGAAAKALTRFGNEFASTKGNESYNRFNNNKLQTFNMLSGVSGTGQVASNQIASQGISTGNQLAKNSMGAGQARASGYMEQGNALQSALGGIYSSAKKNNLFGTFSPTPNGTVYNSDGSTNYGASGFWDVNSWPT